MISYVLNADSGRLTDRLIMMRRLYTKISRKNWDFKQNVYHRRFGVIAQYARTQRVFVNVQRRCDRVAHQLCDERVRRFRHLLGSRLHVR